MRIRRRLITVSACCVLFLLCLSVSAFGAIFNVDNVADLNVALTTAEGNGANDTITLAAGTYDITSVLSYSSTEVFTLTIQGAGAGETILKGSDCPIMDIFSTGEVTVYGLTFLNGKTGDFGGGLHVVISEADLTVTNCLFQGNYADNLGGGASVSSTGASQGTITFDNNVFRLNGAANSGGGLYAIGTIGNNYELQLTNNLFWGNDAHIFHGGGAYVLAGGDTDAASIIAKNTFLYNNAGGQGGGIYAELGSSGSESDCGGTVSNNLFKNNEAGGTLGGGGAFFHVNSPGTAKVINNTCIGNSASGGFGGGFYFYLLDNVASDGLNVTAYIHNNIIGQNSAHMVGGDFYVNSFGDGEDATVSIDSNHYPAIGRYVGATVNLTEDGNISGDPKIEALGDLSAGSPCIDAGTALYAATGDIHGEKRLDGFPDIGADEFKDIDEDGLPNYWEALTGATDPAADDDGDGLTNLEEYSYGLDPQVSFYDASGEWDITVSSVDTDCDGIDIEDTTVTVTHFEGNVTLEVDGQTFEGIFNGLDSKYYLQASETEEGVTITFTIIFELITESSGIGTVTWIATDDVSGELACSGTADITMVPADDDDDDDGGSCFIESLR